MFICLLASLAARIPPYLWRDTRRRDLNLDEERQVIQSGQDIPYIGKEQRERENRGKEEGEQQTLEKFFLAEEQRLVRVTPSLTRLITPAVKKAFVDCLIACKDMPWITKRGNIVDIFMTGEPVRNKVSARILLRMIYMLPSDLPCLKVLRESLLTFAELSMEQVNMRVLEWDFVGRLQLLIHFFQSSQNCESNALLYSLAMLNKSVEEQGNHVGYYFGSINVRTHVQLFLAKEQARKALLNAAGLTPRKGVK